MATNVTVLGASGATVTIPFTSASNAAAAQSALDVISNLVRNGSLTQYQYPGSGAVPSPTLIGGVVVSGSTPVNLGALPGGTYSLVSDSTGSTTAVGATNPMTVASGTGGIVFLNAAASKMFVAGGTNLIANGLDSASAVIGVESGDTHVDVRMGSATINAFNDSLIQVMGGSGSAQVYANGDNLVNVIGDNTGRAVSVFGVTAEPLEMGAAPPPGDLQFIGSASSSTYLAPGDSNVTVAAGSGNLTLVGGAGNALVFANHGLLDGGTGTNYLVSDSLAGATTLMSAGLNDTLIGTGAGNTYIAAGSNALVADLSAGNSAGGATYNTDGGGTSTIYGSVAANSTFNLGAGTVLAYGHHGEDLSRGNIYTDAYDGANQITIGDFVVGQDVFSLSNSSSGATLVSTQFYADADSSAFGAVGTQAILSDGTKIDFLNFNVGNSSFT